MTIAEVLTDDFIEVVANRVRVLMRTSTIENNELAAGVATREALLIARGDFPDTTTDARERDPDDYADTDSVAWAMRRLQIIASHGIASDQIAACEAIVRCTCRLAGMSGD